MVTQGREIQKKHNIIAHTNLKDDLDSLFKTKSEQRVFNAHYHKRLDYLSDHLGSEMIYMTQWFESMKGTEFNAIRFLVSSIGNLRIIYCTENNCAYLLTAFKEKKKGTDYRAAVDIARKRYKELKS